MAEFIKLRITSEADLAALKAAGHDLQSLKQTAAATHTALSTLGAGLAGFAGGLAAGALSQIPRLFEQSIARGIAFNATIADSQVAIANVLQRFQGLSKEAAKNAAGAAFQQIVDLEPQVAGTLQDLVGGFLSTAAAAQSAGIGVEQNIELVGKFANALANANIPAEQLTQELRAIFTGNITPDAALGKLLQIDNADIARAKEAGNLYQVLTQKIGTLGEAGDTFAVTSSTFKSNLDKLRAVATKPFFDDLKAGLDAVNAAFGDPATQAAIQIFGQTLREVFEDIGDTAAPVIAVLKHLGIDTFGEELEAIGTATQRAREALRTIRAEARAGDSAIPGIGPVKEQTEAAAKAAEKLADGFARANAEFDAAAQGLNEARRTPEQNLQAKRAELDEARRAFGSATVGSGVEDITREITAEEARSRIRGAPIDEGAKTRLLGLVTEILKLQREVTAEEEKQGTAAAEKATKDEERAAKAAATLADLEAELQIEQARVRGNEELVARLEEQRRLAHELAQIAEGDLAPAEKARAAALAQQTSELRAQVAAAERLKQAEEARERLGELGKRGPDFDAGLKGGRGARLRREAREEFERELQKEAARLPEGERAGAVNRGRERGAEAARAAQGRFGGGFDPARNVGNADDRTRAFSEAFPRPADESGFTTGAPTGSAFDDFFHPRRTPLAGDAVPPEVTKPPADGGAGQGGGVQQGAGLNTSAQRLSKGGDELSSAGSALDGAAGDISSAARDLTSAAQEAGNAAQAMGSAASSFSSQLSSLASRVSALERNIGY